MFAKTGSFDSIAAFKCYVDVLIASNACAKYALVRSEADFFIAVSTQSHRGPIRGLVSAKNKQKREEEDSDIERPRKKH